MADRTVNVRLNAQVSGYMAQMQAAGRATANVGKQGGEVAAQVGLMNPKLLAMGTAWTVAGAAALKTMNDSVQAASNLSESTSKMQQVFGAASKEIVAFAEDSSRSFGLSKRAAYDAASTFGIFGRAAGLSGTELAKFSEDLATRAVDMSSFFNGTVDDAVRAVGSALRGESEPIRQYGVLLDDATLRARALQMGLIDSVKQGLDPQTRALAAAQEVMEQSNIAAGDYTKTIDGLANSQREAAKAAEDAQAKFGESFAPTAAGFERMKAAMLNLAADLVEGQGLGVIPVVGPWLDLAFGVDRAAESADGLGAAAAGAAGGVDALGSSAAGAAGGVASMDEQMRAAIGTLYGFIDAQQSAASGGRDLLGMEDRLREAATGTAVATGGRTAATKSDTKAREAATKALNDEIAGLRKADAAKEEAEIKAARRRAERKAEARADAGARKDVQKGVAEFIENDKAAKRGEDIDGFKNTNTVGEAEGSLSDAEQKALNSKIEGIRARHQKALDAQIKGLREANKAANATVGGSKAATSATRTYTTSLDENTAAGRRNLDAIDAEIDRIQANAQAVYDAAIANGATANEAAALAKEALLAGRDALLESAASAGFATDEVKKYLKVLGLVPSKIKTTITIDWKSDSAALAKQLKDGYEKARAMYDGLGRSFAERAEAEAKAKYDGLGRTAGQRYSDAIASVGQKRHSGGHVYGSGDVPATLQGGEYVIRRQQAMANADLVRAINNGTGTVSAGGGYGVHIEGGVHVTAPSPVAAGRNVIDSLAEQAYRDGGVR